MRNPLLGQKERRWYHFQAEYPSVAGYNRIIDCYLRRMTYRTCRYANIIATYAFYRHVLRRYQSRNIRPKTIQLVSEPIYVAHFYLTGGEIYYDNWKERANFIAKLCTSNVIFVHMYLFHCFLSRIAESNTVLCHKAIWNSNAEPPKPKTSIEPMT